MKKFLAVYIGKKSSMEQWNKLEEKTRQELEKKGISTWKAWAENNAKVMIDGGNPLGKTKLVNKAGISDTKNELCAYAIVEAESHEAAAKMFLNHPHFSIFPGDSVEIMECLSLPTM